MSVGSPSSPSRTSATSLIRTGLGSLAGLKGKEETILRAFSTVWVLVAPIDEVKDAEGKTKRKAIPRGFILPGRVTLAPFKIGIKVQEGEASGKDGGKPVFRGVALPRAQFTCEIDTGDDYFMMDAIVKIIMPIGQPTKRNLYNVYHPTLARYKCNVCFCEWIEETPPNNGGPVIFKLFLVCVFSRDDATHTPTKSAATSPGNAQAIDLIGNVKRINDVRDRPTDGGGRPTTP